MELQKAKKIYGDILKMAHQARAQLMIENSDNFAYQTELSEETKDEFKAISVLTSVAFRELVKAGLEPEPVVNRPGFVKITINDNDFMCLGSVLQGTLEQSITKSALREEAENVGIHLDKQNENDKPISTTTINNNGISASDLAEILKAAISPAYINPVSSIRQNQIPQLQNNDDYNVPEEQVVFSVSDFENEYETPFNEIIFEANKIMYSSHMRTMKEITVFSAPLQIYKSNHSKVPLFVYVESDEEISFASAYDNFTPDGKIAITIDDIDLLISGAFDSYGGYHMTVESKDPFIKLITMDRQNNGNASVAKNGHPKFSIDNNEIIIDVIPIGIDSDHYIILQKTGDVINYIQIGDNSELSSALVIGKSAIYTLSPDWEDKTLIVHMS